MTRSCRWPQECGEQRLGGSTRLARGARSLSWVPGSSLQNVPVVRIQPDALRNDLGDTGINCRATLDRSSILIGVRVYVRPPRSVTIIAGFVSGCQTRSTHQKRISRVIWRTFAGKRIFGWRRSLDLLPDSTFLPCQTFRRTVSTVVDEGRNRRSADEYQHCVGKTLDRLQVVMRG